MKAVVQRVKKASVKKAIGRVLLMLKTQRKLKKFI